MKEKDVQKAILDWLAAKRILAFRMNTGVADYNGRKVAFGVPGMADIVAFPPLMVNYGCEACNTIYTSPMYRPYWFEVKAPKGKQSELQRSFQEQVESHGHRYILAKSLDDVIEALEEQCK